MAITAPERPHVIDVHTRLGLRAGGRRERYLRLFAWRGIVDHAFESADPLDSAYGLYCECPAHDHLWCGPRRPYAAVDPEIPPVAAAIVLPWAEAVLTASAAAAAYAVSASSGSWPRLVATLDAQLHLDTRGTRIGWRCAFLLAETPDPGHIFLRLGVRPGGGWHVGSRPEVRTTWGGTESGAWKAAREAVAAAYARPLAELLGSIERAI